MHLSEEILRWLLDGDVAIQFQVYRDLLDEIDPKTQRRIAGEGWGRRLLDARGADGHWGRGFYQPKWISSHYSLLELRLLCAPQDLEPVRETIAAICAREKWSDGGVNPSRFISESDVCVNGMFLSYACWFRAPEADLKSVVDFILMQQLPDGGFNCRFNRSTCHHSSLHSTLSVAEGIAEYLRQGYEYRAGEMHATELACREFMLLHQLFISDRTGKVINQAFLKCPWPSRWKYDILRAMDYFRYSGATYDERMEPAIRVIKGKQKRDGRWNQEAAHPGLNHIAYEPAGKPGRWNTLRALRVLKYIGEMAP